jgi:hypothetical protein
MVADFGCVLAAWAVAYLLRLGLARIYVVTLVPEMLFIVACAAVTVTFLKFRGQYFNYRTRFHKSDARRILIVALGVGFGSSALARLLDIEIISRTAIVLAPPLSALFMINWRMAFDHFGSLNGRPAMPRAKAVQRRNEMVIVNFTGIDLAPFYRYLEDPEANFDLFVFGPSGNIGGTECAGKLRFTLVDDLDKSYAQASRSPEAVIALPQAELAAWQADPRYRAQPGHRFATIESLLMRARELGGPEMGG